MAPKNLPDQAYLRECFDYDAASGHLFWRRRPRRHFQSQRGWNSWNVRFGGKQAGCVDRGKRLTVRLDYAQYAAHRVIYKMETGDEPSSLDHRDRDGTNNRLSNLRAATHSDNRCNKLGTARVGLKGVSLNWRRWGARIQHKGRTYCLGTFDTPEEAHAAYCEAAGRLHGEFANFGHY